MVKYDNVWKINDVLQRNNGLKYINNLNRRNDFKRNTSLRLQ